MIKEHIHTGDEITTTEGFIKVLGKHSEGVLKVEEHTINFDEDDNETEKVDTVLLTYHDINSRMKEVDGKNHNIIFE